ncbi:hypothetical protein [Paenarthrobacter nitroguajacolicus]
MSNARPTPNRRRRETDPDEEARIEAFAQQAETLRSVSSEPEQQTAKAPATTQTERSAQPAKAPKDKSYTFRMTEDTLNELRDAAAEEDRSIQWVFDRILLPALRNRRATN